MNKEDYSIVVRSLTQLYQGTSLPVAMLDRELNVLWANQAATETHPTLKLADGLFLMLPEPYAQEFHHKKRTSGRTDPVEFVLPFTNRTLSLLPVDAENPESDYLLFSFPLPPEPGTALHPQGAEQLVSAFTDQFRSPLTTIFSTLSVLRSSPAIFENTELEAYLQNISENGYLMLRNCMNLTEYIRQNATGVEPSLSTVDLTALLKNLCEAAGIVCGRVDIPLRYDLPNRPVLIQCDQRRITNAILQLLSNSCKFTREGNFIQLSLRETEDQAIVTLRDRGVGIPSHLQEKVFDPYFSWDPQGAPSAGLGLGSTLFKYIIQEHGGTVALSSEEDLGTTVVFTLPKCGEDCPTLSAPSTPADYLYDRFSPLHVLLSDSCPPPKP